MTTVYNTIDFTYFFEGAEKRIVLKSLDNFIEQYDINQWKKILATIGCTVLNVIGNENLIMFLLSESTFIVTKNYLILKTCGVTTPLNLIEHLNSLKIKILDVEYSHPVFIKPELQKDIHKSFGIELKYIEDQLNEINFVSIKALHMYYLYSTPITNNNEITLWDFCWDDSIIDMLYKNLENWIVDDYKFIPYGYSLNAFNKSNDYITIHVTPNISCSYLSLETNNTDLLSLAQKIIDIIKPKKIGFFSNNTKYEMNIEYRHKIYNSGNIYIKFYS